MIRKLGQQVYRGHGAHGAELRELDFVWSFEPAQCINDPGGQIPRSHVAFHVCECFLSLRYLGLQTVGMLNPILHLLEFCLLSGFFLRQISKPLILMLDQSETQTAHGCHCEQKDQYELITFFFWKFAKVHRFFSGQRHSRLNWTTDLPSAATSCGWEKFLRLT